MGILRQEVILFLYLCEETKKIMAYTIKEVASKLSISIKSARRLVASGEIEAKNGGVYRISKSDFDRYISAQAISKNSSVKSKRDTALRSAYYLMTKGAQLP